MQCASKNSDNEVRGHSHNSGNENIELNSTSNHGFRNFITNKKGVSLILFYKDGCPACTQFKPHFKTLADEYEGRVCFRCVNLNYPQNEHLSHKTIYNIDKVPSISIFKDGKRYKIFENDENQRDLEYLLYQYS